MLNWLKIVNLALIESADVEFGSRFNVITGETGAGKSILLGTVGLLLGERADKSLIRTGQERCEISAGISFSAEDQEELARLLNDCGIPWEPEHPEIQLRRVITKTQNRNFVNDTPVTIQTLKLLGEQLIDIHGANEHQSLLSRARQLAILDRYANLKAEKAACRQCCLELKQLEQTRSEAFAVMPSAAEARQLEAVVYDIEKVSPEPGEDERISAQHQLAANARQVLELTGQSGQMLCEAETAVTEQLSAVYRHLLELERLDPQGSRELLTRCDLLIEGTRELAGLLEHYAGKVELDEETFQELELRLSELQTLKRHYGPTLEQVFAILEDARHRLSLYQDSAKLRAQFAAQEQQLRDRLAALAADLSAKRRRAADTLCAAVRTQLATLGFQRSHLAIAFQAVEPGENGGDQIDFIFSANPGETPHPLRQIASSGELSRVMLALKTVLADADAVPVVIFDEIDVNIGGETANQVGRSLAALAVKRQILSISHLAQVAACGDRHYAVSKKLQQDRTFSHIKLLDQAGRIRELSRMLGGGPAAERHAAELLAGAGSNPGRK